MGNSTSTTTNSNQFQKEAKQPLVRNDSVTTPDLSLVYGSLQEQIHDARYVGNSALLDPSGHLSQELQEVLDEEFMKYSNGILVMSSQQLTQFLLACYPDLKLSESINNNNNKNNNINITRGLNKHYDHAHNYYNDRVKFIMSRYGKPFKEVRNHFAKILNIPLPLPQTRTPSQIQNDISNSHENETINDQIAGSKSHVHAQTGQRMTVTMTDHHVPTKPRDFSKNNLNNNGYIEDEKEREARIVKQNLLLKNMDEFKQNHSNERDSNSKLHLTKNKLGFNNKKSNHAPSVSIQEDQNVIEKTIYCDTINENDIVLPKTKFLLFYRKSCFDREMMVRLELTELGYMQFRGMCVDRSKSIDVLAYKVQQLRNREQTHLEEKERIINAKSAQQCAELIGQYIQEHDDPLDNPNDNENIYRKRRPVKFNRCCYVCCPCIVCIAKCCC